MEYKKCCRCKETKELDQFNRCKSKPLGRQNECRICERDKRRKWEADNREWVKERDRIRYSKSNKKKNSIYNWRSNNKKAVKRIAKKYNEKNKEIIKNKRKEYYLKNKEEVCRKVRNYHTNNSIISIYRKMKYQSKRRGFGELTLTFEEFKKFREDNKSCYYCGDGLPLYGSGMDRIDNGKGYTLDNVVPCCFKCNKIRNNSLTSEEMKVAMDAVLKYRKSLINNG